MGYVYRNGREYLIKYRDERRDEIVMARPRKFG
jgi:hypothetical protein